MSSCPSLEPEACLEDGLGRAGGPRARPQATAAANRSPHLRLPSCKGSLWVPRLGLFDVQGRWTDAQGPPPTRGRTVCGQAQAPQVPASLVRNTPTGRPPPSAYRPGSPRSCFVPSPLTCGLPVPREGRLSRCRLLWAQQRPGTEPTPGLRPQGEPLLWRA